MDAGATQVCITTHTNAGTGQVPQLQVRTKGTSAVTCMVMGPGLDDAIGPTRVLTSK